MSLPLQNRCGAGNRCNVLVLHVRVDVHVLNRSADHFCRTVPHSSYCTGRVPTRYRYRRRLAHDAGAVALSMMQVHNRCAWGHWRLACCLSSLVALAHSKIIFTNNFDSAPNGKDWEADLNGKTAWINCAEEAGGGRSGRCCDFGVSYCPDGSCYRAETKHVPERRVLEIGREFWFGFALMLPSNDTYLDPDLHPNILHFQLHGGDNTGRGPVFGLKVDLGDRNASDLHWSVTASGDDRPSQEVPYPEYRPKYTYAADLGSVRAGQWEDFVVNVDLQYKPVGKLRVWRGGHLLVNRSQIATAYNDHLAPYVKTGAYLNKPFKINTEKGGTAPHTKHWSIRYWQLNVADAHSSFAQVSTLPSGAAVNV